MKPSDEEFARGLRERLQQTESLDAVARARLSAARARALGAQAQAHPHRGWAWGGAGALLAAGVLAAVMLPQMRSEPGAGDVADVAHAEALEFLFDDDGEAALEPEFYEDLDVLTWLAEGDGNA